MRAQRIKSSLCPLVCGEILLCSLAFKELLSSWSLISLSRKALELTLRIAALYVYRHQRMETVVYTGVAGYIKKMRFFSRHSHWKGAIKKRWGGKTVSPLSSIFVKRNPFQGYYFFFRSASFRTLSPLRRRSR